MSRRIGWPLGLAVALIGVAGWLALRPAQVEAPPPDIGAGRAAPPENVAVVPPPPSPSARARYENDPDRAAVFRALADEPEPASQYFAYRAAADCAPVLGPAADWNDVQFEVVAAFTSTAHDRALDAQRRNALAQLAQACRGFTRPAVLPRERMLSLRAAAAAAGHPAAIAAERWDELQHGRQSITTERLRHLAEFAFASGDPFALRESEGAVLSLRHATPVAGLGKADLETLEAALALVECTSSAHCGGAGLRAAIACVVQSRCAAGPVERLLSPLTPTQQADARRAAGLIAQALQQRSLGALTTTTTGR